jgi:2-(1,2-epoxy-1,2-dihydrophenyl)acetyl-CoA isomerase
MDYEQITYTTQGPVVVLTLSRPARLNAWTRRMSAELTHAITAANDDPAIGAIIVTGEGRGFCAGADVDDQFQARLTARDEGREEDWLDNDWVTVAREAKPLIAAVNGVAVGIGLTMILPFDVIVASDLARFGMFFIKMALVPELASTYFLVQRVGFAHASEMCLTGRLYSADEAARTGLVNVVVPHARLLEGAMERARAIAANPDRQLRWIKELLTRNAANSDYRDVMRLENDLLERSIQSPEHREAVQAFRDKRPADFRRGGGERSTGKGDERRGG